MSVFVDQDGTFYPSGWRARLGGPPRRYAYSLRTRAHERGLEEYVQHSEDSVVNALARFAAPKRRLFVLVHGYNNDETAAGRAYGLIEERLNLRSDDGVLAFHWDGLVGSGVYGAKIWFPATGYSQLAGQRGLRQILNQLHDKTVIVVAHSRGVSTVLSALTDPPYSPTFERDTRAWNRVDVRTVPPLQDHGNRIHLLLLAPAVGDIDFRAPTFYDRRCTLDDHAGACAYRALGSQVKQIHHTVNARDPVLRKFVGLDRRLNPTNLGTDTTVAQRLRPHLPTLSYTVLTDLPKHAFDYYVRHPNFPIMLRRVAGDSAAATGSGS